MRSIAHVLHDALMHTGTASLPHGARMPVTLPVNQARILVIDGSPRACRLLDTFLHRQGYTVQIAASARAARQAIIAQAPDLVLLDLLLPDASGADLLRDLRRHPQTAPTPIIVLSALDSDFHIAAGLQHGADDYITKPTDLLTVLARIQEWLQSDSIRD